MYSHVRKFKNLGELCSFWPQTQKTAAETQEFREPQKAKQARRGFWGVANKLFSPVSKFGAQICQSGLKVARLRRGGPPELIF